MTRRQAYRRWKRLAPAVFAHFRLTDWSRRAAREEARRHPLRALRSYLAIAASLR